MASIAISSQSCSLPRASRTHPHMSPSPNSPQSLALARLSTCAARRLAPLRDGPPPPVGQAVGSAGPGCRRWPLRAPQVGASYEGCGKIFIDAVALRKHAHVHGERQYICHYENCGKKFLDSSKLKRHFLIHTGEKNFVCPHEGCGKAFSLDFNLKAHMKTHSADKYHVCQYPECGRRFTQESKLRAHIRAQHEKNPGASTVNHNPPDHHHHKPVKSSATPPAPSADRPYVCLYDSCDKAYIHEYKLNLHLRKEHPNHDLDAGAHVAASLKRTASKNSHRSKPNITAKMPPPRIPKHKGGYGTPPPAINVPGEHQWPRQALYENDSEETEEEGDNAEDGWRYKAASRDDEKTEDEE